MRSPLSMTKAAAKNRLFLAAVGMLLASVAWIVPQAAEVQPEVQTGPTANPSGDASPDRAILNRYCVSCHNQRGKIGKDTNVMLDVLDPGKIADGAETWERVVRKLRTREMPPQGVARPDEATYESLIASLETALDRTAVASP